MENKFIWTIGHSTIALENFIEILKLNGIKVVTDVRKFPVSRKFPQFNHDNLAKALAENEIEYIHILNLGGKRKVGKDTKNTTWEHPAFRGFADYMETETFQKGINELSLIAERKSTAIICAEALWWRCHRALIADYLKLNGWIVIHIFQNNKTEIHPYTSHAKIIDGKLDYSSN